MKQIQIGFEYWFCERVRLMICWWPNKKQVIIFTILLSTENKKIISARYTNIKENLASTPQITPMLWVLFWAWFRARKKLNWQLKKSRKLKQEIKSSRRGRRETSCLVTVNSFIQNYMVGSFQNIILKSCNKIGVLHNTIIFIVTTITLNFLIFHFKTVATVSTSKSTQIATWLHNSLYPSLNADTCPTKH